MGANASLHEEDAVWKRKDEFLSMSLEDKRKYYPGNYVTLNTIKPWSEYFLQEVQPGDRLPDNLYPPHDVINSKISLWQGDITELEIEAIVNSAARPEKGGQVNMAIINQAGEYYKAECIHNGLGCPGEAMLTGGYCLPARYIVNTLSPKNREKHILRNCYTKCLDMVKNASVRTIAFPCVGTRKNKGFKMNVATVIALETIRRWMEIHHSRIDRIIFCVYSDACLSAYKQHMQKYFPIRGHCSSYDLLDQGEPTYSDHSDEECAAGDAGLSLEDWRDDTMQPGMHELSIRRGDTEHFIKQLYKIYNTSDDLRREPIVTFEGEAGIDDGGLSKEYFFEALDTLLHSKIHASPLFEGPVDHILPCPSKVHMSGRLFETVGKVLAHSVLHYGIGMCGLSRAIVYLLTHRVSREEVEYSGVPITTEDILDMDMRRLLEKDASDLKPDDRALLRDYMESCNIGYLKIDGNFLLIKQELMCYEIIHRRWDQIEAIREGMDEFGLYAYLCLNPSRDNIREVFPAFSDVKLLPHMIVTKMTLVTDGGDAWEYFKNLLSDIHNGKLAEDITLNTLMLFWTGQPVLPTTEISAEVDPDTVMPQATTCYQRLFIPGGCANFDQFTSAFKMALQYGAKGFGEM